MGIVKVGALDDPEGETLVLVERVRLDQESMDAVRQEALKLDRRGYRVSEVYCQTEPIAPNPPAECSARSVPAPSGNTPAGGSQPPQVAPAPTAPAVKPVSRPSSCYAKRSRRSARRSSRRRARRVARRNGGRALLRKMPMKTCAERLSRR